MIKPSLRKAKGYLAVSLSVKGKFHNLFVHRLVCIAFHGPAPSPIHQAAHDDGNKLNNIAINLIWKTPVENAADKERHGTQTSGEAHRLLCGPPLTGDQHWSRKRPDLVLRGNRNGKPKLTEEQIKVIKAEPNYRGAIRSLARKLGISEAAVGHVRSGRTWSHV